MIEFKNEIYKGNKYVKGLFLYLITNYDYYYTKYTDIDYDIKNIDLLLKTYKSPSNIKNDRVQGGKMPLNSLEHKENLLNRLYKQKDQLFSLINLIDDTINMTYFNIKNINKIKDTEIKNNTKILSSLLKEYPYNEYLA